MPRTNVRRLLAGQLTAVGLTLAVGATPVGARGADGVAPRPGPAITAPGFTTPGFTIPVPPSSGTGRRIVWGKLANRVWLVDATNTAVRDFPVTDLDWKTPVGNYSVLKKSRRAYSSNAAGTLTLNYFVPFFRRCSTCGLIGFHAIPVTAAGSPIQPESALGSEAYHSEGCIRSAALDARALYDFSAVGTKVVVVP